MTRAIFLSYASQDADVARRLCDTRHTQGLNVWVAKLVDGSAVSSKKASNSAPAAEFCNASKRLIRHLNTGSHSAYFVFPAKAGIQSRCSPNDQRRRVRACAVTTRRNSHTLVAGSSASIDAASQWVARAYAQRDAGLASLKPVSFLDAIRDNPRATTHA
jgi:hypothetical protein